MCSNPTHCTAATTLGNCTAHCSLLLYETGQHHSCGPMKGKHGQVELQRQTGGAVSLLYGPAAKPDALQQCPALTAWAQAQAKSADKELQGQKVWCQPALHGSLVLPLPHLCKSTFHTGLQMPNNDVPHSCSRQEACHFMSLQLDICIMSLFRQCLFTQVRSKTQCTASLFRAVPAG